ncbi:related to negative regulator of glucose-repressible genes [Cephalotrichum gorgonifer]|uniref:Related to negative regulator of glucose-repressible genes n=1 Tax=Cephalotrichum gorgonifer TaxID=2041049 RepID=A0AAE8MNT7_9PEZI|nr:related to negative regulator of glucose-repressible genes [Cephalotrichum gorgonifer]
MAVVLSSEEDYFTSTPMRRTRSQTSLAPTGRSSTGPSSSSTNRIHDSYSIPKSYSESISSSAPSSPIAIPSSDSTDSSFVSTPASNVSISSDCDDVQIDFHPDDHFVLPDYDHACYPPEELEPPPSPRNGHSYSSPDSEASNNTSRPVSPEIPERAEDDTAVKTQPTRHVDYLSHNWTEEEIWSSWRYIVSRRKDHVNSVRLENASWRTWLKKKNNLTTVSPETLNWLKECDVTWLYGPLQTQEGTVQSVGLQPRRPTLPKTNSFINKKPILKKRSMSEIMLRRSLSTSSLLKEAAAAVHAQEKGGGRLVRPALDRAATEYVAFPFSSRGTSIDTSVYASSSTSGIVSPTSERKRIHFNEQVEQCIAVDVKGDDDGDDTPVYSYGSDSDDGAIMMKRTRRRRKRVPMVRKKSKGTDSKTIAMLPSTTLKDRQDSLEVETAMKHSTYSYGSPLVSPSSSQETLRADGMKSKKSKAWFFSGDDNSDEETVYDFDGAYGNVSQSTASRRTASSSSSDPEPAGMRRTPSGMFMPCDEAESPTANDGVFSRILDTVNTARDIAHVIWNVGWRQ